LEVFKAAVDPKFLLQNLGLKIIRETPKELSGPCKIHGGDNTTSFRFNKDKRTWVCFSHKCHELYGCDIIGLIMATLGIDFMSAVDYLRELVGNVGDIRLK
jgi:hypothetical protein